MFKFKFFFGSINVIYMYKKKKEKLEWHIDYSALIIVCICSE